MLLNFKFAQISEKYLSLKEGILIKFKGAGISGTSQGTYFFINYLNALYFSVIYPASFIGES